MLQANRAQTNQRLRSENGRERSTNIYFRQKSWVLENSSRPGLDQFIPTWRELASGSTNQSTDRAAMLASMHILSTGEILKEKVHLRMKAFSKRRANRSRQHLFFLLLQLRMLDPLTGYQAFLT